MKLALVFLSCFIAASQQQYSYWNFPYHSVPQFHHLSQPGYQNLKQWANAYPGVHSSNPGHYSEHYANQYYFPQNILPFQAKQQQINRVMVANPFFQQPFMNEEGHELSSDQEHFVSDFDEQNNRELIESRLAAFSKKESNKPESRAGGLLLPALLFGTGIYGTSTKYSIVTTTVTSTSVISCIISASFSAGSTTACRRRREMMLMKDLLEEHERLSPSQVQNMEPSAVVDVNAFDRSIWGKDFGDFTGIESSIDAREQDPTELWSNDNILRANRAFGYTSLFGATTTSTLTTAVFSVTASRKTVTLGSSLLCLPAGFSVC